MTSDDQQFVENATKYRVSRIEEKGEIPGNLWINEQGFLFRAIRPGHHDRNCSATWIKVDAVDVDGADALQKRITVTRFFVVGFFALALKKKTGEVYAYIKAGTAEYLFKMPKKSAPEARAIFAPYKSKWGVLTKARQPSPTQSIRAERIRCMFCARMIPADSDKCTECGVTLKRQSTVEEGETDTKTCPYCAEDIKAQAIKCKHCGERLDAL